MTNSNREKEHAGIVLLLTETLDAFGRLVSEHIKLARVELVVGMKTQGRLLATLAVVVILALFGYVSVALALTLVLSRSIGLAGALFLLGALQLLSALAASIVVSRKVLGTASDINQSLTAISGRTADGSGPTASPASGVATSSSPSIVDSGASDPGKVASQR